VTYWWQQDKVFLAGYLGVNVLVGVLVQCRDRSRVSDPQVGGVGVLLEGYTGEGDILWDVLGERQILVAEVVVF
jgi:hypothetical protein